VGQLKFIDEFADFNTHPGQQNEKLSTGNRVEWTTPTISSSQSSSVGLTSTFSKEEPPEIYQEKSTASSDDEYDQSLVSFQESFDEESECLYLSRGSKPKQHTDPLSIISGESIHDTKVNVAKENIHL
jgi:hypothetical protein